MSNFIPGCAKEVRGKILAMPSLGVFGKTNVRRYKIVDLTIRKIGLDYLVEIVRKLDDSSSHWPPG